MHREGRVDTISLGHTDKPHRDKAYKTKFQEWKFGKNIPKDSAVWMILEARRRKRELNKGTRFWYGNQQVTTARAERSLKRCKIVPGNIDLASCECSRIFFVQA